jgi:hypothetical protein
VLHSIVYRQRPAGLEQARCQLDEAVFAACGWPADLGDDDLLARLLALNLERAAAQATPAPRSDLSADDGV